MGCISSAEAADLCTAVERSKFDDIRKIAEAGIREDDPDKVGRTALHVATGSSQWDKVGWSALQGLHVNGAAELLQGFERKTPGADGLEALKLFNRQSSNRYSSYRGPLEINASVLYRGATPLILAVGLGRWQVARWILENHGRSAGLDECEVGWAALHFACCSSGNEDLAKQLITLEADVNLEDSCGEVPLFLAAQSGSWGIVNLLLRSGAKPKRNSEDIFALADAAGVAESVRTSAKEGMHLRAARFVCDELSKKVDEGDSLAFMHSFAKMPSPSAWASTLLTGPDFSKFKQEASKIFEVDDMEESTLLACQQKGVTLFLAQQASREKSYRHTSGLEFSLGSWRVSVGLCYAHQVGCQDTSEYKDALSWHKQAMLMPSNWDAEQIMMNGEWCSSDSEGREFPANFLMRKLDDVQPFQDLFDACMRTVYTRDRHGDKVPDALKVHKVLRCQNDQVFAQYHRTRLELQKKCRGAADLGFSAEELVTMRHLQQQETQIEAFAPLDVQAVNECWLFHGTSPVAADLIARNDFRLSKAGSNAGTLYGRGLYFAQNPSKSDEYSSAEEDGTFTIIIARVILGRAFYTDEVRPDVNKIESSCRPLPTMGGATMVPNTYQSVVGDREKSRGTFKEIVVFDDDQVYPEFIVKYRRVFN